jgi:hypothetical protein
MMLGPCGYTHIRREHRRMVALDERTAAAVRALAIVLAVVPFLAAVIAVLQTMWWIVLGAVAILAVFAPPFAPDRFVSRRRRTPV